MTFSKFVNHQRIFFVFVCFFTVDERSTNWECVSEWDATKYGVSWICLSTIFNFILYRVSLNHSCFVEHGNINKNELPKLKEMWIIPSIEILSLYGRAISSNRFIIVNLSTTLKLNHFIKVPCAHLHRNWRPTSIEDIFKLDHGPPRSSPYKFTTVYLRKREKVISCCSVKSHVNQEIRRFGVSKMGL